MIIHRGEDNCISVQLYISQHNLTCKEAQSDFLDKLHFLPTSVDLSARKGLNVCIFVCLCVCSPLLLDLSWSDRCSVLDRVTSSTLVAL